VGPPPYKEPLARGWTTIHLCQGDRRGDHARASGQASVAALVPAPARPRCQARPCSAAAGGLEGNPPIHRQQGRDRPAARGAFSRKLIVTPAPVPTRVPPPGQGRSLPFAGRGRHSHQKTAAAELPAGAAFTAGRRRWPPRRSTHCHPGAGCFTPYPLDASAFRGLATIAATGGTGRKAALRLPAATLALARGVSSRAAPQKSTSPAGPTQKAQPLFRPWP